MTEEVFDRPETPAFIHLSHETATWLQQYLTDDWEFMAADNIHVTYHVTRALIELRSELGMEIDA